MINEKKQPLINYYCIFSLTKDLKFEVSTIKKQNKSYVMLVNAPVLQ